MKKNNFTTVILIFVLLAGLSLLLYPSFSDYWNSYHSSLAIADYSETVKDMDSEKYKEILEQAQGYNSPLKEEKFYLTEEEKEYYGSLLDVSGNGVMGYIEIPKIGVYLPIYHGTEEAVLQVAIGHLEWSDLPIGGESTHCVLSGHRGLPSAKLFTNLDKMQEGDTFVLRILDEVFTYEVDRISIVEPEDTSQMQIEQGQDLCTLVTCTPYGINTHRLLVRGHRVENTKESLAVRITSEANQIDPLLVAPIVALPVLGVALIIIFIPKGRKNSDDKSDEVL